MTIARRSNRGRRFPVEVLTPEEVKALMSIPSRRAASGVRNRSLIAVLYRGGLRISEALALRPKDVDFDIGAVTILHGKGGKRRVIGLDDQALALLQLWMVKRKAMGIARQATIFCTLAGKPLQSAYVRNLLPRLGRKAGIEKRVHAHGLRHTCAAEMRREGLDLLVISRHLGHRSVSTTHRYLAHLAPEEVVAAARARQWEL